MNIEEIVYKLTERIVYLEAMSNKDNERIAFLENELEARIKLAAQFHTAKS